MQEASVGADNPFTIQARDAFDNDITMGGAEVNGSLTMADGTEVPLTVVDNGDGTYRYVEKKTRIKNIKKHVSLHKLSAAPTHP